MTLQANGSPKKGGMAILISGRIDLRLKEKVCVCV